MHTPVFDSFPWRCWGYHKASLYPPFFSFVIPLLCRRVSRCECNFLFRFSSLALRRPTPFFLSAPHLTCTSAMEAVGIVSLYVSFLCGDLWAVGGTRLLLTGIYFWHLSVVAEVSVCFLFSYFFFFASLLGKEENRASSTKNLVGDMSPAVSRHSEPPPGNGGIGFLVPGRDATSVFHL